MCSGCVRVWVAVWMLDWSVWWMRKIEWVLDEKNRVDVWLLNWSVWDGLCVVD